MEIINPLIFYTQLLILLTLKGISCKNINVNEQTNLLIFPRTTGAGTRLFVADSNNTDDNTECRSYHNASLNISDMCEFVRRTDDCQIDEGLINYTEAVFCSFSIPGLGIAIMFCWWLFLFVGLALSADDFFCPSLAIMSDTMGLSHNIAGVTLMAFGNGAPDIFSAIAAIGNSKGGDAGLALGALLGAGVFVTTIVPAAIALVVPFKAMERPFIRDIVFYLAAIFATFVVLFHRQIRTAEAIGFILLYVGYVLVVVVGRYVYQKHKNRNRLIIIRPGDDDNDDEGGEHQDAAAGAGEARSINYNDADGDEVGQPDERSPLINSTESSGDTQTTPLREFLHAISPIDIDEFREKNLLWKIYDIVKAPIQFLITITTPVMDPEKPKANWNRHLNSLHAVLSPIFCILATKHEVALSSINGVFPVMVLILFLGLCLAAAIYFTSQNDQPPRYHKVFAFAGFVVAVIWIYAIANEIVNILQMFGIVFNLSNAVLGLTLLAWGNSIGDLVADTVMARAGYPRAGISACFGGPLFNLLLGIGIPFTIGCIKRGGIFYIKFTLIQCVLAGFLALSLVSSLIYLVAAKFYIGRAYGFYLIGLYVTFLIVALLVETDVIKAQF